MRTPQLVMLALIVIALVQMLYFNHLIDRVILAAHFNGPGNPNGWQTKRDFFLTYALLLALGVGLAFGLPALFERVPAQYVNMPHREYWLVPERREQTLRRLADQFAWLGVAIVVLVIVEMQIVLSANLSLYPHIDPLGVALPLLVFLAFVVWWLVRFVRGFAQPT